MESQIKAMKHYVTDNNANKKSLEVELEEWIDGDYENQVFFSVSAMFAYTARTICLDILKDKCSPTLQIRTILFKFVLRI
jgi:hypothetical protein